MIIWWDWSEGNELSVTTCYPVFSKHFTDRPSHCEQCFCGAFGQASTETILTQTTFCYPKSLSFKSLFIPRHSWYWYEVPGYQALISRFVSSLTQTLPKQSDGQSKEKLSLNHFLHWGLTQVTDESGFVFNCNLSFFLVLSFEEDISSSWDQNELVRVPFCLFVFVYLLVFISVIIVESCFTKLLVSWWIMSPHTGQVLMHIGLFCCHLTVLSLFGIQSYFGHFSESEATSEASWKNVFFLIFLFEFQV